MRYLIDTNICIYILNKRPAKILTRFKKISLGDIGISSISLAELQYGVSKSSFRESNQQRLNEFLVPFEILSFEKQATKYYGDIRTTLEKKGQLIGPLDMLIAAHALSESLILITNNSKEFNRISNLKVENWVKK